MAPLTKGCVVAGVICDATALVGRTVLASLLPLFALQSIGECKSKAEEDRIIMAEVEVLKQRFSDPKLDKTRGREYMVRLLYCEMLGHDASFAYVKALQFASEPNILTKKVGVEATRGALVDRSCDS